MKRGFTVAVVVAVALWGVAAVPAAASVEQGGTASSGGAAAAPNAVQTDANETEGNETVTNETLPPGARLAGVVGVQQAEIEGEVETRAFGIAFANASSNASKASVVAAQVERLQERLAELQERREELRRAVKNGSMSRGAYAARMAELATETSTVRGLADRSENASRGLPAALLERKGINASAIQTLKRDAANMTGQEVAAIARSIAGPPGGLGVPGGPPVSVGPPGEPGGGNETGATDGVPGRNGTGPGNVPGRDNGTGPGEQPGDGNETDAPPAKQPSGGEGPVGADPVNETVADEDGDEPDANATVPAADEDADSRVGERNGSTDPASSGDNGGR